MVCARLSQCVNGNSLIMLLICIIARNETIDGIAIDETPDFGADVVVAADFSSTILSRPIDVSRYGVIYAGAQKISARLA